MTNRSGSVLLMALVCTLATLGGSCCDRRITSKQVSPSGKMLAIVTATHCGSPGGDGTAVTMHAAKKSFFAGEEWYVMRTRSTQLAYYGKTIRHLSLTCLSQCSGVILLTAKSECRI